MLLDTPACQLTFPLGPSSQAKLKPTPLGIGLSLVCEDGDSHSFHGGKALLCNPWHYSDAKVHLSIPNWFLHWCVSTRKTWADKTFLKRKQYVLLKQSIRMGKYHLLWSGNATRGSYLFIQICCILPCVFGTDWVVCLISNEDLLK